MMNELSSRRQLSLALQRFIDSYPSVSEHARRTLDFVNANPDCCKRSLLVGHVTGSAWVVDDTGEYVLLTHHRFLDRWLQLGGHVDDGETVADAALREAKEESGIETVELVSSDVFDVDVHPIPARPTEPPHFHYDVRFLCRASRSETIVVTDESHDVAWIEIAKLEEYNDSESMLRMGRLWMDRLTGLGGSDSES